MNYRKIVKDGGAIFVSVNHDLLRFQVAPGEKVLSLYTAQVRSAEDIRLAVKAFRESHSCDGWPEATEIRE